MNINEIKKMLFISLATFIIGFIIILNPDGLDKILFNIIPVIFIFFLLPFIDGILLVLVQNKDRSYEFLPILFLGVLINGIIIAILFLIEHFLTYGFLFNFHNLLEMFFPLIILGIIGGLIGLLIRGITLLIRKYKQVLKK
jgi:hypothetical protein